MPIYTNLNEWLENFKGPTPHTGGTPSPSTPSPSPTPSPPTPVVQTVYPDNVFITPIAKTYKSKQGPCSKRDWEEQLERKRSGLQMMWDGPAINRPQPSVGDLMITWFHMRHVEVYRITEVLKPSERLPSWSTNIGQTDRSVVYLDKDVLTIDWNAWISMGGFKRCMGTTTVSGCKYNIIEHWLSKK